MVDTEPVQQPFFDTQSFLWQRKNLDFIEWVDLILRSPEKLVDERCRERDLLALNSGDQEVFTELGVAVELSYPFEKDILFHYCEVSKSALSKLLLKLKTDSSKSGKTESSACHQVSTVKELRVAPKTGLWRE